MSAQNDGGPAFPTVPQNHGHGDSYKSGSSPGMTLRDWFAGQAISSVLQDEKAVSGVKNSIGVTFTEAAALMAYVVADDMLKARDK